MFQQFKKNSIFLKLLLVTGILVSCESENNSDSQTDIEATDLKLKLNLHVPSPQWQDQIIYFLMIDRFNDGDRSNNDQGEGEFNPKNNSYFSGGDLKGISKQLDYIQKMGATAVWITPPISNQWVSNQKQATGYHGYWAKDFKNIDVHFGTIKDYKELSSELHNRGMYLIQDIVTNHTGNYFYYEGKYNPENIQQNFKLSEEEGIQASAPNQYPFSEINVNNPTHKEASIYHWTPEITDFNDPYQEKNYQLSGLADLNTSNPEVIEALKNSYSFWIKEVGVDGFRIDTVKFVDHPFWNKFLQGDNGIIQTAKATGREHFLNFGEVFEISPEFSDIGELKAVSYLGSKESPELNSVIGFSMFGELGRVFAQGRPTANLAYRLKKHMDIYPNPFIIPNFIDNHDTQRFLAEGNKAALKQALFTLFTIPGIPVIYQGTEQAMTETRQAMFKGGFHSDEDHFESESEMFSFIKELAELRRNNKVLSRGSLNILAEDKSDSGVLVFSRVYNDQKFIIILNSSDREKLMSNVNTGIKSDQTLKIFYQNNRDTNANKNIYQSLRQLHNSLLTMSLPPRNFMILEVKPSPQKRKKYKDEVISIDQDFTSKTLTSESIVSGKVNWENAKLKLVINGNLKFAKRIEVKPNGSWSSVLPVSRLGVNENRFVIYSEKKKLATLEQNYFTRLDTPQSSFEIKDPVNDDKGPTGKYKHPQHQASNKQMDIEKVLVNTAGDILEIGIKVGQISTVWNPANGFDNVSFSLFFSLPNVKGKKQLPGLNISMPKGLEWSYAHVFYGWGNSVFTDENATSEKSGKKISASPQIVVDKVSRLIKIKYNGQAFGLNDWSGVKVYISTWDKTGEGEYRPVSPNAGKWDFTAESVNSPKVLDDVFVEIPNIEELNL